MNWWSFLGKISEVLKRVATAIALVPVGFSFDDELEHGNRLGVRG